MSRTIKNILLSIWILSIITGYSVAHPIETPSEAPVVESMVVHAQEEISPTPTPIPTDIVGYINYKFGPDAPKAFLLLKGNEECHGENPQLDPKAICNNELWGGKGQDRGYWQISNYYHPNVSDWCASDVKCSTDYAFRMYTNNGNTFKRWTAGRCLGI